MSAIWPVVAMALGLAAVLYAVWPMLRGRPEPPISESTIDSSDASELIDELARWSERAGEVVPRRAAGHGRPPGSGAAPQEVAGPGAREDVR